MAPLNNILPSLHKRDYSCTYYDTSCSTHRLVIMVIIVCVGIFVTAILGTLFIRSRRNQAARLRAQEHYNHHMKVNGGFRANKPAYEALYGAPPPYEPRRPERVARANGEWR